MIPKKPKDIVKIVAEDLNISAELVDDLSTFYYKTLRKKLSDVEDLRYRLDGLGDFLIRNTGVNKVIKKFESMNNGMEDSSFVNYHNKKIVTARLAQLYEINKKIDVFMKAKQEFKKNKYGE
jgi:hypothetical protein